MLYLRIWFASGMWSPSRGGPDPICLDDMLVLHAGMEADRVAGRQGDREAGRQAGRRRGNKQASAGTLCDCVLPSSLVLFFVLTFSVLLCCLFLSHQIVACLVPSCAFPRFCSKSRGQRPIGDKHNYTNHKKLFFVGAQIGSRLVEVQADPYIQIRTSTTLGAQL